MAFGPERFAEQAADPLRASTPVTDFDDVDARAEVARQIAIAEKQLRIMQCRDDLLKFSQFMMPDPAEPMNPLKSTYEPQAFHAAIARHLEEVERGDMRQLILTVPPRHGKTQLATKNFAAWCMGRHPEWDIVVASYSDDMAQDFGADTRAIVNSRQYKAVFPEYSFRKGGTAKDNIQSTRGGRVVFAGKMGPVTGRGANIAIIDDIFKDHEEARSQTTRDMVWNWLTRVLLPRRMGLKLVMIIMTRWHPDDIVGRLTDENNPYYSEIEAKKWKIIRLPAIAEEDDVLGRTPGEALWPERYDLEFLASQQRLDPLGFAALYQQRPTVADGVLFRRETIQYYRRDDLPSELTIYCASDHAVGEKQRNDPSCLLKVGVDKQDNIYVLECDWRRMAADAAVEAMITMASGKQRPVLWWAEKGHISKAIGPFLRKRMSETGTYINIVEVTPSVDKTQRAQSIAGRVAQGKVFFPRDKLWTEKAVDELLSFPNGLHDDFCDALAYIGLGLGFQFGPRKAAPKRDEPKFGTFAWVKQNDRWQKEKESERLHGGY